MYWWFSADNQVIGLKWTLIIAQSLPSWGQLIRSLTYVRRNSLICLLKTTPPPHKKRFWIPILACYLTHYKICSRGLRQNMRKVAWVRRQCNRVIRSLVILTWVAKRLLQAPVRPTTPKHGFHEKSGSKTQKNCRPHLKTDHFEKWTQWPLLFCLRKSLVPSLPGLILLRIRTWSGFQVFTGSI